MKTEIKPGKVMKIAELAGYDDLKVTTTSLLSNASGSITLLAFRQGQTVAQHAAPGDVMIIGIEGKVEFTLDTERQTIHEGDMMIMRKGTLHSVKAISDTKFLLVKINAE